MILFIHQTKKLVDMIHCLQAELLIFDLKLINKHFIDFSLLIHKLKL
jgi:hypothetical protein